MKRLIMPLGCGVSCLMLALPPQPAELPAEVALIRNVNTFDGTFASRHSVQASGH